MREQRKVVTILFCDVVGSTALGESTDPEALRARMRRYFEDLRGIVERHGGVVEKFVGDAVMAVFGIPTSHEDDALRAVRAAAEMRTTIAAHGLEARIGVNTGEVVVGGEGETLVTGDAVNVAARLEQAAGTGETLIGAGTRMLIRDAVRVEDVEPLAVKGKAEPVDAYRLIEVIRDAAPVARRQEMPIVGRERERQRLWRDFEDAVADRTCRLFTLLGPAGIGKSRLVADFLERLGDSADVLRGRCLSYGEGITYWPLVEILLSIGVEPESIVASTPADTRLAFRRLLEARAAERPQVVVIDDLQWAEPVLVDLVEHVADLSRGAPIFLLCVARTELLDARPEWAGGKLNATSLLLEPLGAEECADLIENLLGDAELDDATRVRIAAASEGNALYVEEMVAMVRERNGGADLVAPPTIHALLQARLDLLGDEERVVVGHASVEGQVFHRGAVAALVPPGLGGSLDVQLSSLVRKELVRPDVALLPGEEAFRFRHLLIRDAAYGAMPKELRADLHERLAQWLERTASDSTFEQDEILGYHLEQAFQLRSDLGWAGDAEAKLAGRAADKLLAAGMRAFDRGDANAAATLLGRGIALLPTGDPRRLEVLRDRAVALARIGEFEESGNLLRSTIDEAARAGNERVEARARLALRTLQARIDPEAHMADHLQEAIEIAALLEDLGDLAARSNAYERIGSLRFMLGRAGDGDADLRTAAELAERAGAPSLALEISSSRLRPMLYGPTPASDGLLYCEKLLSEKGQLAMTAHASQARALFAAMQGDFELARSAAAGALALIEELGLVLARGLYACDIGYANVLAGDLETAEAELRAGDEIYVSVGETGVRATVTAQLADVLAQQGKYEEAVPFVEASRALAGADDLDAQPRWRVALARLLLGRGDTSEAERVAREAVELLDPTDFIDLHADALDVLGAALGRCGRVEEAISVLEQASRLHERKENVVSAGRSRAALDELRATRPS